MWVCRSVSSAWRLTADFAPSRVAARERGVSLPPSYKHLTMSTFAKKTFDAVGYAASRPCALCSSTARARPADALRSSRRSYPPALYQHILSRTGAPFSTPSTLLDLGCGPGLSTFAFASSFARVLGLDPSEGMVKAARGVMQQRVDSGELKLEDGKEVRFEQGQGERLQGLVENQSVDLVVAGEFSWMWRALRRC